MTDLDDGRTRLLDAAERLVALYGYDVPTRAIVRAAAHRNHAAVEYHFGSRLGLMDAVWERRTRPVNARRSRMLAALEGELAGVVELVDAWVDPFVEQVAVGRPSYWARFNEARLGSLPLDFLAAVRQDLRRYHEAVPLDTLMGLFAELAKQVADGVQPDADRRVALAVRFVIGALASWERDVDAGVISRRSLRPFTTETKAMVMALLLAPRPR